MADEDRSRGPEDRPDDGGADPRYFGPFASRPSFYDGPEPVRAPGRPGVGRLPAPSGVPPLQPYPSPATSGRVAESAAIPRRGRRS